MTTEEQIKALQTEIAELRQEINKRVQAENLMFLYFRQSYLAMVDILERFLGKKPTTSEIRRLHKEEHAR